MVLRIFGIALEVITLVLCVVAGLIFVGSFFWIVLLAPVTGVVVGILSGVVAYALISALLNGVSSAVVGLFRTED